MSRDLISDDAWAVIEPLFPALNATGQPRLYLVQLDSAQRRDG
jgi:transposase